MGKLNKILLSVFTLTIVMLSVGAALAQSSADLVAAALNHPDRSAEEAQIDASRLPLEVLSFAGITAGMDVMELEAGDGWYTEIISRTVGPSGSVLIQNPELLERFVGDADDNRAARFDNVTLSTTNFDALAADTGSMDLVTWILGPHELWFSPDGISLGDPEATFQEIARVLKPGGRFLAIDHHAPVDSGTEVGGTLHRIPEGLITEYAEAAGLSTVRRSTILQNSEDPLNISVFDPAVRGQSSRFVVLYEK